MASTGRRLAYSLVPLVVVMGGTELGLRAADWPRPDGAFAHNEPFWLTDPGLVDEPFPHREEHTTFPVTTDDNGLRAPIHPIDKRLGTPRIMALGCSTTFGWGVGDDESYPARLEALFAEDGVDAQVINGGQPGYTSFQGAWLWDTLLRYYEPDIVFIGYVVQDARMAAYTDRSQAILQQDGRYLKEHLLYRSRVYLGLRSLLGQVQVRAKERGEGDEGGVYRVPPEDYAANLRTLVDGIRDVGGEPVLFGFPLEREGYTATHRRILAAAAEALGARHLELQPRMDQASREATLYFERDRGHPNAAGQALIAEWVHEWLVSENLLGGA